MPSVPRRIIYADRQLGFCCCRLLMQSHVWVSNHVPGIIAFEVCTIGSRDRGKVLFSAHATVAIVLAVDGLAARIAPSEIGFRVADRLAWNVLFGHFGNVHLGAGTSVSADSTRIPRPPFALGIVGQYRFVVGSGVFSGTGLLVCSPRNAAGLIIVPPLGILDGVAVYCYSRQWVVPTVGRTF